MQPRNFNGKQVYELRLPPNYDSDDSCLSDSDNEYLPPPKRSLCLSNSSSDEESNGSDGQRSSCALVENEVNANFEVSVKSGVLGPSNQTASRRIIWKSIAANANGISRDHEKIPCQSQQIREIHFNFLTKNYLIILSNKVTCMLCTLILPNHYFSHHLNWNNFLGQCFI